MTTRSESNPRDPAPGAGPERERTAGPVLHGRPSRAPGRSYDLVIVGGGAHGALAALESARRGLRPLLLERDDFGGQTSRASLRIVHGGLRYLQSCDLARHRESVAERRWMLQSFPTLVRPLRCVMPLRGRGLRRRSVLRAALALDALLSRDRNRGLPPEQRLPAGEILDPAEATSLVPEIPTAGLDGAASWHDAEMVDSARLLVEVLRWATARGAVCLNYTEVERVLVEEGRVRGVRAHDRLEDRHVDFGSELVIDCSGPRAGELARELDGGPPGLFEPSLAFNLLVDAPLTGEAAAAVSPPRDGSRTYFVRPWKGLALAGTFHAPRPSGTTSAVVSPAEVEAFLADLRAALPGWEADAADVRGVLAGLVPVRAPGTVELATSPAIHHHGADGGPRGLFSVRGVKYTTARSVGEEVLRRALAVTGRPLPPTGDREPPEPRPRLEAAELLRADPDRARRYVEAIVHEEAVTGAEDLLMRRTDWELASEDPEEVRRLVTPWVSPP